MGDIVLHSLALIFKLFKLNNWQRLEVQSWSCALMLDTRILKDKQLCQIAGQAPKYYDGSLLFLVDGVMPKV